MTIWQPLVYPAPRVMGLAPDLQVLLDQMWRQWLAKLPRNVERELYLDGKNKFKDLGIAIPPQLAGQLEAAMGWPLKAVYELANRIVWERVHFPGSTDSDSYGLDAILRDNAFASEFPQAVASSLSESLAFGTATRGDTTRGEPPVLLMFHSASRATGLWDRRLRALKAGMVVGELDSLGRPTSVSLLTRDWLLELRKGSGTWYIEHRSPNHLGRVPMEMLPFRPVLKRPYGRSRIDRQVITLTDRAVRTIMRMEIHSELFSAMKLILLGADESTFEDQHGRPVPLWSFYMGRLNTLGRDEEGELPQLEKISAESPEPHIAVMRQIAAEFSGHTGVPLSSLGIATDNPESADSKRQAREDIVGDAEAQHTIYGHALRRLFADAVVLADMGDRSVARPVPSELETMVMKWRRPDRPTLAAVADAGAKVLAADPSIQGTEIAWELLGLAPDQIDRLRAEKRRADARAAIQSLTAPAPPVPPSPETTHAA